MYPNFYDNPWAQGYQQQPDPYSMMGYGANPAQGAYDPYSAYMPQTYQPYNPYQAQQPYGSQGYVPQQNYQQQPPFQLQNTPTRTTSPRGTMPQNMSYQDIMGMMAGMQGQGSQPQGNMPLDTRQDGRGGQTPFPNPWDYRYPGLPEGMPPPANVGGENGQYRIPYPWGQIDSSGNMVWPWESGEVGTSPEEVARAQDWMNTILPWILAQRGGNEFNQQFNANQYWNSANFAYNIAAQQWAQGQQQAQFDESKYQFDVDADLRQQVQDFNEQAATGMVNGVPTMEMRQRIDSVFQSRGQAPQLDANGNYITDNQGNVQTANTLEQNKYIADAFGFRINPNTGQRENTLPYQQYLSGLSEKAGWIPVIDPQTGQQVIDPRTGNYMMMPSEEHSSRIAQQFGYRINPQTGEKEKTLEATWQDLQAAVARSQATGYYTDPQSGATQQTLEYYRDEFARAMDRASQTGLFVDPLSGQATQTTAEQQRNFENLVAQAGLTGQYNGQQTTAEQQRNWQNQYNQRQQAMDAFGTWEGQDTLAKQQQDWSQQFQNRGQFSDILSQTGYVYDPYTNEKKQTLAGQQQGWQQGFQQSEADRGWQAKQAELMGYMPSTTGSGTPGPGGDYTPGSGQPNNPWAEDGLTLQGRRQKWEMETQFPQMQETERRGQNFNAWGRATRINNAWT